MAIKHQLQFSRQIVERNQMVLRYVAGGRLTAKDVTTGDVVDVYMDGKCLTPHTKPMFLDSYGRITFYAKRPVKLTLCDYDGKVLADPTESEYEQVFV